MTLAHKFSGPLVRGAPWCLPLAACLFIGIFVFDCFIPQGYSVPTLYLLPLILTHWLKSRYAPAYGAATMTLLTLSGLAVPPTGTPSTAYFNRTLAIVAGWVLALLLVHVRQRQERLEFENLIAQRTEALSQTNTALETQIATLAATEKVLRETQDRFNLVVSATQIGIWDWDLRTNRMYYSPLWKESLGYADHEISDSPSEWETRLHPDDRDRAFGLVEQFLSGRIPTYRLEHRLRHKDGRYLWILTDATLLRDEHGIPFRMTGSHQDITDQKQAEQALRESEDRYRGVITALAEGIVVLDELGTIVSCNPSACLILGNSAEKLVGRNASDPSWHTVHEDGSPFPTEIHPVMVTLRTGKPQANVVMGVHREDGRLVWISINTEALVRSDATNPYGIVASFRDITASKETEHRLRRQEHEFRVLADNVPGFFSYVDRQYRYQFVNKAHEMFFGLPSDRILGRSMMQLLGKGNFEHAKPYLDAALAGRAISFEYCMSREGKPTRWMKVTYVPDTNAQDQTQGVYALVTDVTESKQAEAALRQSESILRSFFESGILMMGVVELCHDEIVHISDNATAAAFFGTTPEEMRNRTATALGLPRDTVNKWIRHYQEAARTGSPVKFEYAHVHRGKTQHLNATVCSIGQGPGGNPRFSYVAADVTEQRLAAERLHRNLTLLSAIMNGTTDAIYLKDMEGRYLLANPAAAAAAGRTVDGIVGLTDWDLFSAETAGLLTENDHLVIVLESTQTLEEEVTTGDVIRTYLSTKDVYRDESGTVIGVIGVSRDITERKRVERELQAANERYRDLSRRLIEIQEEERRAIAHDLHDQLGQLLTAIKLELSSLKKRLRAQPATPNLDALLTRVGSSLHLVDQAIDASRHAAMGLRPTHLDDLGLVEAIQWLAEDLESRAGIVCELTPSPDHSSLQLGEPVSTGLFRITQELLTNVARHAEASEVYISLTQTANLFVLQIADNGVGIATETAAKPTGFGLRGVRERCSLLNGEFSLDSTPGKGTIATVRIPLPQEAATSPPAPTQIPELRP